MTQKPPNISTLNIHHHRKQLALKALNKHSTVEAAAKDMGITGRTLHNWKKMYKIERVNVSGKWQYRIKYNTDGKPALQGVITKLKKKAGLWRR